MLKWTAAQIILATLGLTAGLGATVSFAGEVEVKATGLRNANGNLIICLWKETDKGFPSCGEEQSFKIVMTTAARAAGVADVPDGTYAVTVLHDEEKLGKPKRNAVGIPVSGIGLANNPAIGPFNRPTFAKAAVVVKGKTSLTIKMNYL